MALACGADLVLELPVRYACASAEFFAGGAVSVLDGLRVVDYLCFGSESGDTEKIAASAHALLSAEKDDEYRRRIRQNQKEGSGWKDEKPYGTYVEVTGYYRCTAANEHVLSLIHILLVEFMLFLLKITPLHASS